MPTKDANLVLRATSDAGLTATAVFAKDIGGTPLSGLAVQIYVPAVDTATDATLSAVIRHSTASDPATTDQIIAQLNGLEAATGFYYVPFSTWKRSIELELIVGGTSPDFSIVLADIVEPQQPWRRNVEFR
jgi:hypothetical protein